MRSWGASSCNQGKALESRASILPSCPLFQPAFFYFPFFLLSSSFCLQFSFIQSVTLGLRVARMSSVHSQGYGPHSQPIVLDVLLRLSLPMNPGQGSKSDPWGCGDAEELWLCIVLLWVEMAAYWRCSLSLQWDLLILALTFSNTWDLFYCLAWGLIRSIRMTYFNFYLNASQASGWLLLKDWAPKDLNWPLSLNGRLLFWSK